MEKIRILHLFRRLLSLYGEYGNMAETKLLLRQAGYTAEVSEHEYGQPEFSESSMIYIGAGTETALKRAAKRLLPYKEEIAESVRSGAFWLCTGNSMALFGKKLIFDGEETEGLGIFDYSTVITSEKRYSGDVLTDENNVFDAPLLGYVNTACVYEGIKEAPLCRFSLGRELGNDKKTNADGFVYNNFYATQLTGPLLVKNPAAAEFVISKLTKKPFKVQAGSNIVLAYKSAYGELCKRV